MSTCVVYVYGFYGYYLFQDDFYIPSIGEQPGDLCTSLGHCILSLLYKGFRQGEGVGGVISLIEFRDDPTHYWGRLIYDNSFFILCQVLLTNMIMGMLVDTFRALNEEKYKRTITLNATCFICDGTEETITSLADPKAFESHKETEHNLWHYFFYHYYLVQKSQSELTNAEFYVFNKMKGKEIDWFPSQDHIFSKEGLNSSGTQGSSSAHQRSSKAFSKTSNTGDNDTNIEGRQGGPVSAEAKRWYRNRFGILRVILEKIHGLITNNPQGKILDSFSCF
jgi:hypothetical protein